MTLSEALFSHVSALVSEARVYAAYSPMPKTADEEFLDVVVLQFNGAVFTAMDEPVNRDATYLVTVVSRDHLRAVQAAELIARDLHGFGGLMGGDDGVKVIDIQAEETAEDFDAEHFLFARSISLLISYEF